MKRCHLLLPLAAALELASPGHARAEVSEPATSEKVNEAADLIWRARLGVGVNPVVNLTEELPNAHLGSGASLSGFIHLPYRLSAGLGFDWERYTFDSQNYGDGNTSPPRYRNEVLTHSRLMALLQWDIVPRHFITPYVLVGTGYGWEGAKLTTWQCHPDPMHGLVLGGGGGLDVAFTRSVGIGLEYRANTLPLGRQVCTDAFIVNEPKGPPSDFFSQRVGITLSVQN